jgi:hypothetical protein
VSTMTPPVCASPEAVIASQTTRTGRWSCGHIS